MNDPTTQPIDIEAERTWLRGYKDEMDLSWPRLAAKIDIPSGTLSQFGGSGYSGKEGPIAEKVYRFRQTLVQQKALAVEAPEVPDFYETPTGTQIETLLHWGQRGRIVLVATGAGCSKTKTAKRFQACGNNVFMATMTPSTTGVNNMQQEVLAALGEPDAVGTPQKLSRRICDKVKNLQNPLLVLDEAQHLSEKAIEEARSWHDRVGLGIAFLGNIPILHRLEGGSRKAAFAQLFSRIGMRLVRATPLEGDADALAAAWKVTGQAEISYIRRICMLPGGLRGATFMLELGWMLAASTGDKLKVDHLEDAWAQLSSRGSL
jgi:DNA transposition AAA+ family ATPase